MKMDVLDHGYVALVETWGSDQRIVEAARMSTQKGFEGWGPIEIDRDCAVCRGQGVTDDRGFALVGQPFFDTKTCESCRGTKKAAKPGDEKLLRYLYENKHATPFEMAGMVVEVEAPIMVFREWHRHRTQSYNEASARYAPLPALDYLPTRERVLAGGGHLTKQAGAMVDGLTAEQTDAWLARLAAHYEDAEDFYQWGLGLGIPKELARLGMPVGRFSKMRASCNLRNWLGFLTLRMDPKAQWEIRQYAEAVGTIIADAFPRTWSLFVEARAR